MNNSREQSAVAAIAGVYAAILFWLAFLCIIFVSKPDAQNGIAVCISPAYALWFGASAGLFSLGWQKARAALRVRKTIDAATLMLLAAGIIGAGLILCFLAGEYYQATHPIVHPAVLQQ